MSDPIVGIDLGTSNTVVAHAEGDGMAVVLADANGFKIHPSVVSFHPSGGVVVGAAAKQRKVIDPKNTIYSVKRLIGRAFGSKEVQEAKRRAPFTIKEGGNQLPLVATRGGEFAIPEISAIVLDHAKNVASHALQTDVSRAVVTVPASFNDAQRSATATAGSIAGLTVVRVLNEPTAAALAYGHSRNLNETIAVYDFGGGTFDITILKLHDQVYEVLGTSGDSFLGGDDLDERIVDRMVDKFLAEHRVDLRTNEVSMMRLRAVAEQTKIELSRRSRAVVRVDEIAYGAKGKPLDLQIEIRREEFVSQVVDIIDKTFPVCAESMKLAGLSTDQIDDVILVGGTTKIPYVRDMVTKFFNKAPRSDVSPEDAVALGAGLQATALERTLKRKTPSTSVVEGIPKAIGLPDDDLDDAFDGLGGETNTFARDELTLGDEDTFTKPELGRPGPSPAAAAANAARARTPAGDRPVERGKHHDVFDDLTPPPVTPKAPVAGPVIGRMATKQIQPGAKTSIGIPTQAPPPTPPSRSTAPRHTAQRPPAVPPAPPQAKTMMLDTATPASQQSTVIIDQDAFNAGSTQRDLSPAATAPGMGLAGKRNDDHLDLDKPLPGRRGDEHLDLDDDFGFPNLTTDKGFVDLDFPPAATAKGLQPAATTARGMPTPPPPATRTMPAQQPSTTARGMPTPPPPAPTRSMPAQPQTIPVMPEPARPKAPSTPPYAHTPISAFSPPARAPVVLEVTPRGLGIATVAGFCEELIRRNSRVPTEMKKVFSTSRDDQDVVRIVVVQGESRRMQQNTVIADLTLTGLQRRPRGETTIEVTFMIDANGILNVRARDAQTGREERASLDIIGSIAEGDVSASREKLQALRR